MRQLVGLVGHGHEADHGAGEGRHLAAVQQPEFPGPAEQGNVGADEGGQPPDRAAVCSPAAWFRAAWFRAAWSRAAWSRAAAHNQPMVPGYPAPVEWVSPDAALP